jgi:hypothetical protein
MGPAGAAGLHAPYTIVCSTALLAKYGSCTVPPETAAKGKWNEPGRIDAQQRACVRRGVAADGIRARLRVRSEHVALRNACVRVGLSHCPVRLCRIGAIGPRRLRCRAVCDAGRIRPGHRRDLPGARSEGRDSGGTLGEQRHCAAGGEAGRCAFRAADHDRAVRGTSTIRRIMWADSSGRRSKGCWT